MIDEDQQKRKVGRPFKGKVEEFTKEPNVPERRSILRAFKKFYAKLTTFTNNSDIKFYQDLLKGLSIDE